VNASPPQLAPDYRRAALLDIIIANTAEAFANLLDRAGAASDRALHERDLAGRALFWGGREKIIVTPNQIAAEVIAQAAELLDGERLEAWTPAAGSLRLCADILGDHVLLERLRHETAAAPCRVYPYAITPEFCELSDSLGWGDYRAALRAAEEVDSKAGFRRLFENSALLLPKGRICEDAAETAAGALALLSEGYDVVVKIHNGESGWGLKFIDAHDFISADLNDVSTVIATLFGSDLVWSKGPYIVEERIRFHRFRDGYSPSGEATVEETGVRFDYVCDQILSADGAFAGICIDGAMQLSPIAEEVRRQTLIVGELLRASAYRGTYDVDFVIDTDGRTVAVESNVRLTGGTHVIGAARSIFGERWRDKSFFSDDAISYAPPAITPCEILRRLSPVLLRRGGERGVILSFVSASRPILGAIGVGSSREEAIAQLSWMQELLAA
jgi:hypothetical protein